jgi:hypothetical protein
MPLPAPESTRPTTTSTVEPAAAPRARTAIDAVMAPVPATAARRSPTAEIIPPAIGAQTIQAAGRAAMIQVTVAVE